MSDIVQTKELVHFGLSAGVAVAKALEDGKLSVIDVIKFLPVLKAAKEAFQGLDQIPAELGDLSDVEKAELVDMVKADFDLADDKVEAMIEAGFEVALNVLQIVTSFKKKE
jgi:hypothetical protein